jgi:hypothetical protein
VTLRDIETIAKHMTNMRYGYLCADCIACELPKLGDRRVNAAFTVLSKEGYLDPALLYAMALCSRCERYSPVLIAHANSIEIRESLNEILCRARA